ncbi:hypothetical protein [Sphingomonas sp. ID0503]|uniref:hypothetical protein n=1 Tax=Sphingomonas sp. ID0503 TaxID=3399691 RepID=UPI003AFB4FC8
MRLGLIVIAAMLVLAAACHPPRLTLDFAREGDPHSRRIEVAAEVAGLAAALAIRWSSARFR